MIINTVSNTRIMQHIQKKIDSTQEATFGHKRRVHRGILARIDSLPKGLRERQEVLERRQ